MLIKANRPLAEGIASVNAESIGGDINARVYARLESLQHFALVQVSPPAPQYHACVALGFPDLKPHLPWGTGVTAHFHAEAEFHLQLVGSQGLTASPQLAVPHTVFPLHLDSQNLNG